MAFEGDNDHISCTIGHNIDDGNLSKKVVHQFYFAKIDSFFPEIGLQVNLNAAKKLKERIQKKRKSLFNKIQPLKEKLNTPPRYYDANYFEQIVVFYRKLLEKHCPESINEDTKDVEPDIEVNEIKVKIQKFTERLGHGRTKWSEEKQILKELEHLQTRMELLDRQVKEAETKRPSQQIYWSWGYGSKYDLKRTIHGCLKKIRECEEQERVAKMQRIPEIAKMEKQLATLERKYNIVKQEEEKAKDRLDCLVKLRHTPVLEMQVKKQVTLYEKYCKIVNKAQEVATQKDLVTLEELSINEIEEFMCRWTNDDEFRANYTISIQLSLANRDLCSDGRRLDQSEMITTSSICTK